ncbi:MAG TPA: hypothetical protein DDY31_00940 [Lachnospiraceae bacterium]|nr:hypothetical protein [Lachnospiraceae bacterium]
MREYAKEQVMEMYGEKALEKIEAYLKDDNAVNMLLVYAEGGVFEIIGGILTSHSMSTDDAISLLDIDMDAWSDGQGWDGWNQDALTLVDVM